jgi:hypothetical protein
LDADRFVEDEWLDAALAVGETLALDKLQPTLCASPRRSLRKSYHATPASSGQWQQNIKAVSAFYASVRSPGLARVRDPVALLH